MGSNSYNSLTAFKPHFPGSRSFKEIDALISATHALSFYSLTLQHGVPFQPVSIRVHHDPLSLIGKVLDQNPNAYTKLDDLISIGHNLVAANLPSHPKADETSFFSQAAASGDPSKNAERRIIYLAISSALSANDFGTAYSYILTRLTPPSMTSSSPSPTDSTDQDDISWRAAYNAGRHRSTVPESGSAASLQNQISHLSQRMELLSLALVLTPSPDPLPEILGVWRRCDEEMNVLRDREVEEAESWDARADMETSASAVPGGFMPSDNELDAMETERERAKRSRLRHAGRSGAASGGYEEAPMGLFDVARGAAQAISKNAFPLHGSSAGAGGRASTAHRGGVGGGGQGQGQNDLRENEQLSGGEWDDDTEAGRTRKRDVVSSMVTGGLASGIGWVLGAQPVNREP